MRTTIVVALCALGAATFAEASLSHSSHAETAEGLSRRRHHAKVADNIITNVTEASLAKRGRGCSGHGTWYNTQTGNAGACGQHLKNDDYVVALAQPGWGNLNQRFSGCGSTITISANGKSHSARIMDACPTGGGNCGSACDLDMSPALFSYFADQGVGKMPISWSYGGAAGLISNVAHALTGGGNNNNNKQDHQAENDRASKSKASAAKESASNRASSISAAKEKSISRAKAAKTSSISAAKVKASKSASKVQAVSKSYAKAAAAETARYKAAPKNLMALNNLMDGWSQMAQHAQ